MSVDALPSSPVVVSIDIVVVAVLFNTPRCSRSTEGIVRKFCEVGVERQEEFVVKRGWLGKGAF